MFPILAGLETEYGFSVIGSGVEDQVDNASTLVRAFPDECFFGWDYRFENPRADLRGFQVDQLSFDPSDAAFDRSGQVTGAEVRSDRVLRNGARFYNDHGHPEYSTPECWSLHELAIHDRAGEVLVRRAAIASEETFKADVQIYKNNSDFQGASYGTHENYLIPRSLTFDDLYAAVMPMLVVRQILCGAGKVGHEHGEPCDFQMSQRADFFTESASVDTLYRRPIFNTRDEPHADPADWIRLHVIAGDANMIPSATRRKVGLIKVALTVLQAGLTPIWRLQSPGDATRAISRDIQGEGRVELEGGSWTTARFILDSYLDALGQIPDADPELIEVSDECRSLLDQRTSNPDQFRRHVDWAAKKWMLDTYLLESGETLRSPLAKSLDLSYHWLDPHQGLYPAMVEMGEVDDDILEADVQVRLSNICEPNRAFARSIAVQKFKDSIVGVSWGVLTLRVNGTLEHIPLAPNRVYPEELDSAETVERFAALLNREEE